MEGETLISVKASSFQVRRAEHLAIRKGKEKNHLFKSKDEVLFSPFHNNKGVASRTREKSNSFFYAMSSVRQEELAGLPTIL